MAFDSLEWRLTAKDEVSQVTDKVARSFSDVEKASNEAANAVSSSGSSWKSMAAGVIAGGAALEVAKRAFDAIRGVAISAISEAARVETLSNQFEVLSGSAEKGAQTLRQLQQVAQDNAVLGLKEVEDGGQRLAAMGISIENVAPSMKLLGDIAGAVGSEKLPQLVTAFGQVAAKGKLMGQEINQFTEAGVPLVGALADKFGITEAAVYKMSEQGKISSRDMVDALQKLSKEKYMELAEKQANTLTGKIAKLGDAWDMFLRGAGAGVIEWAKKFVDVGIKIVTEVIPTMIAKVQALTAFFKENWGILAILIAGIGLFLVKAIFAAIPAILALGASFLSAFGAALAAAAPFLIGGAIIVGLVAAVVWIIKNWDKVKQAFANIFGRVADIASAFATDIWENFKSIGKAMMSPIEAFKKAVDGDFSGALDALKDGFNAGMSVGFSRTKAAVADAMADAVDTVVETGGKMIEKGKQVGNGLADGLKGVWNAKGGFEMPPITVPEIDLGAFGDGASAAADKAKDKVSSAMSGIKEDYEKAVADASQSLEKLDLKHGEISATISAKIDDLRGKLKELTDDYKNTTKELNQNEAEKVIEQEQKIADIRKQISESSAKQGEEEAKATEKLIDLKEKLRLLELRRGELKADASQSSRQSLDAQITNAQQAVSDAEKGGGADTRLADLKAELAKEEEALKTYNATRVGLENELTEARRRASLTDFQRYMEDLNLKRTEAQADHDKKKLQLEKQIAQEETNLEREKVVYLAKRQVYLETQTKFQQFHDAYKKNLENMNLATQKNVDDMAKKLEQLQKILAAIESAKSEAGIASVVGFSGQSGSQTSQPTASPAQQNITVNLGGVTVTNEADERRLVDRITRQLQLTTVGSQ